MPAAVLKLEHLGIMYSKVSRFLLFQVLIVYNKRILYIYDDMTCISMWYVNRFNSREHWLIIIKNNRF